MNPDGRARVPRRLVLHKVGITAAVIGVASLLLFPFTIVAANRVRSGVSVSLLDSLGPFWSALLMAAWMIIAAFSLLPMPERVRTLGRGWVAAALVPGTVALCEVAALRLLPGAGTFARVSVGIGVWISAIAAYAVVLSARREVGMSSPAALALTASVPVAFVVLLAAGAFSDLGMLKEYANVSDSFWVYARNTVVYSAAALVAATALGFALGGLVFTYRRFEQPVFAIVSLFQTIPGLAMIGLLFAPLAWARQNLPAAESVGIGGLGWAPIVTALTLYALLAITRNTFAGLNSVPEEAVDAARGMGMTSRQLMWRIRVPLALPVLFSGERTAAVQTIGNSSLGAFVAAFTLGTLIFGGLAQQALDLTMLGSVAVVLMAIVADEVLRVVQRVLARRSREDRMVAETGMTT